ncbi:Endo-1,4-beta-xylanase C [Morus notabilis]|uniref:Endo-1,4-beta-xylanase C n=1 Tax=Morus notabilis TaxID=981085 RepID=W9SX10_9ROSA|nr:Endo-1,4-beta-xylanase C [Morus notabilis]
MAITGLFACKWYFQALKHKITEVGGKNNLLLLLCITLLYTGGILINPDLNKGLKGWSTFGDAKIQLRESQGNKFIVAHTRNQQHDSVSQKLYLKKDNIYTFSAWIRVDGGNQVPITATFKTSSGFKHAASVVAESHCWSFLKGGVTVDDSGPVELYFESKDTSVDIWVDSVSLQPFTQNQWRSHQDQSIQKVRKSKVRMRVVDAQGKALPNATLSIQQNKLSFPLGCAINDNILTNQAYQNWFTSRSFTVTTFENEMKWYSTEKTPGKEDYSTADSMIQFAKRHNVLVRGHNVFWDDPKYQPWWLNSLSKRQFSSAVWRRLNSVVSRYRGQLIAWDVVNENLHNNFFESKMGNNASATFYNWAFRADPETTMFLNEYNTIENPGDGKATPRMYLQKLREIQGFPGNYKGKMGIGLEAHFGTLNIAYVRSAIDVLAATGLPIWITELDVQSSPKQAIYLEQILRELHSHPGVKGIVIWSAWRPQGCWQMCLTDNNFKNLPTGDVVDKLMHEWGYQNRVVLSGTTDASGFYETSLFHGDYEVKISHPEVISSSFSQSLNVAPKLDEHYATQRRSAPLLIQVHS